VNVKSLCPALVTWGLGGVVSGYTVFGLIGGVPRRANGERALRRLQRRLTDHRITRRMDGQTGGRAGGRTDGRTDDGLLASALASADIAASEIIILHGGSLLFRRHRRRRERPSSAWTIVRGRRRRRRRRHRLHHRRVRRGQRRRPRRRSCRRCRLGARAGDHIGVTRAGGAAAARGRLFFVLFVRVRERVQHGTEHLGGPLGERGVTRAGRLIAGLVAGLLVSVSVARVLLAEDAEEGQEERAEHEDEEAEDDGVLDGGGVEGERGGAVRGDCDIAEPRRPVLGLLLLRDVKGLDVRCEKQGDDRHGVHPLVHGAGCGVGWGGLVEGKGASGFRG